MYIEISEKLSILIEKIDSNHDPINHALENINQHFETIYEKRRDFIDFGTDFVTNNMQLETKISSKKISLSVHGKEISTH